MAIGVVGSSGRTNNYVDYDVTITAQSGDPAVDNWVADSSAGPNAYVQTVLTADISSNLYIDGGTDFYVIPNPQTITESALDQFSWISAAESTSTGIKFYSMTGKPSFDIPVTIRVIK